MSGAKLSTFRELLPLPTVQVRVAAVAVSCSQLVAPLALRSLRKISQLPSLLLLPPRGLQFDSTTTYWPAPVAASMRGRRASQLPVPSWSSTVGAGQLAPRVANTTLRAEPAPVSDAQVDSQTTRAPFSPTTGFSLTQLAGIDAGVTVSTVSVSRSQRYTCIGAVAFTRAATTTWRPLALRVIARFCALPPEAVTPRYLSLSLHPDGNNYAFERLGTSFLTEIGRRQRVTSGTDVVVFNGLLGATGPTIGLDGSTPVIHLYSADDPLGENADGNIEIFTARGP